MNTRSDDKITASNRFAWPLVLLLAGCTGDQTINKLQPDIAAAPDAVDFGEVVVLYDDSQLIQIINAGRSDLKVSDISMDANGEMFTIEPSSFELEADNSMGVEITFAPLEEIPYDANLVITSNDPDSPQLRVPVTAKGTDGPVPDIQVDPASIEFTDVSPDADDTSWVTIENVGDGDLTITGIEQTGSGAFTLVTNPNGQTLAEDGEFTLIVQYEPSSADGDSGEIILSSNDPDEPETTIILLGNGGGAFDYPVPVIECPSTVDPPTTIDLDGTDSYDPNGYEPLTYEWTLNDQPNGSTTEIDDDQAAYTNLFVDLAGDYELQLKVTNSVGIESAPEICEFEAVPDNNLHVELVWNTGDSDLDLHLIQDGYEFAETPGDCCWCNPNPSWGESGDADDPQLALDNRVGYGPENIHVETPYEGRYFIKVHYFEDRGGSTTTATVRVWIDGEIEEERSQPMTNNQVWDVGYVIWDDGVFIGQDNDLESPSQKSCWEADSK